MAVKQPVENQESVERDDWSLTAEQMLFMLRRHNPILAAYEREDMDFLRQLAASDEYKAAFGKMSWDEAFDRYESTWVDQREDTADKLHCQNARFPAG